jgi:hypothetical protein
MPVHPRRFFLAMSIILLAIVLVGFSRTLYLRPLFDPAPLPPHVYAHGAVLTAWFVWLLAQTSLAARGQRALHRKLGVAGALLGAGVVVANVVAVAGAGPRLRAVLDAGELDPAFVIRAIWGDVGSTLAFAGLLAAALLLRRRPDAHGRLMLLASVSIVGQALGRIGLWPVFAGIEGFAAVLAIGGLAFFLASVAIYDFVTLKRLHPATVWGGGLRLLLLIVAIAISASERGQAIVRDLAA